MGDDLHLRRKWTLRAGGRQVVFVKRPNETTAHVLMKAGLWALYLPEFPNLIVELDVGDRYRPDVVQLGPAGQAEFWGEAGEAAVSKLRSLARRYPDTHFALAKWTDSLARYAEQLAEALDGLTRRAPFDLLAFPQDTAERFINDRGELVLQHDDLTWRRFPPTPKRPF